VCAAILAGSNVWRLNCLFVECLHGKIVSFLIRWDVAMQSSAIRRLFRRIGMPSMVLSVSLLVVGAFVAFVYRGWIDNQDIIDSRDLVLQSRSEVRELKARLADQTSQLASLQAKLDSVQAALDAIIPSLNTYNFGPNQSMILADGRLTVGLIGSPTNERVNVNINGKQHSAGAGDVINFALDASTACRVQVQRFDMFRATLIASCAAAKSQ
jgi:hypothetical protein